MKKNNVADSVVARSPVFKLKLTLLAAVLLTTVVEITEAAGFDESYQVHIGHYDGDGDLDLYIRSARGPVVIALDDIPIVIPPPVSDFILRNESNGTFSVLAVAAASRSAFSQWPKADVSAHTRDVNVDGYDDLILEGLTDIVSGAFDQIVYSPRIRGKGPLSITAANEKFRRYHSDLVRWMLDPDYFDNVPLKVQSSQPPTAYWFGFVSDPGNFAGIFGMIERCKATYPTFVCGYTSIDPVPNSRDPYGCIRPVILRGPNLEPLGTDPNHNVCQYEAHVYVYVPGTVTVVADTSIYDTDAKETADILRRLREECVDVPINDPASSERLEEILARVYGDAIFSDQSRGPVNIPNSGPHPPCPGDGAFNPSDDTYHHYDVTTDLCIVGTLGCNETTLRQTLRYFSYPSKYLEASLTKVDGVERVLVYITLVPGNFPRFYNVWGGYITQRFVLSGVWQGAIQNVTTSTHIVYPGSISRTLKQTGNRMQVFTHGIGLNRLFCSVYEAPLNMPVQMIFGFSNDVFGAAAFRALDRQMKKYRESNPLGPPQSQGSSKPSVPALVGEYGEAG